MVALTNRPPETIYPVNTRLILPFFAEEGEQGRPPLHGRITAFIPGRGAYADPLVPFHPRTGREEDLPHYTIQYLNTGDDDGERVPCDDVHGRWELCSPRLLQDADYSLDEIDDTDAQRGVVVQQFLDAWRHPAPRGPPRVVRVLRVRNSGVVARFDAKCAELRERRGEESVVERVFHGTTANCDFGLAPDVNGSTCTPCQHADCALCNICCTGFQATRLRGNARFPGRYGSGLYFSSTSSKSNDYAKGVERVVDGRRLRGVLVCDVAAGKSYSTKKGFPFMPDDEVKTILARGHDSLRGLPGECADELNYDELVIYDEEQAVPVFLIAYELDATHEHSVSAALAKLAQRWRRNRPAHGQ